MHNSFNTNSKSKRYFSVVEIVSCPLAGLDKNIYPCCSAIDYKFTHAEMRRNGISPIVSVTERGPRVRVVYGRLRINVGSAVTVSFPVCGHPALSGCGAIITIAWVTGHLRIYEERIVKFSESIGGKR